MPSSPSAIYTTLRQRTVVITGGATGIGAALVAAFLEQECRVAFIDIADEAAAQLAQNHSNNPPRYFRCDLRDIAAVRRTIGEIETHFGGGIQVLVNNAARDDRQPMLEVQPEEWDELLAVNLKHQFFVTQAVAPGMIKQGGGSIILFGSVAWMFGAPGMSAYTTAKAAIYGLTRTFSRELGGNNIRVNCIVPGAIRTERQLKLWETPEKNQMFLERQSLKFRLQGEDVARVALFLASDEARGCTGQNFFVDAGLL